VFWQRFERLGSSDNQIVKGEELRQSLLSSGKFHQSDAALMDMIKAGQIEETPSYDVYCRRHLYH
jgi:hypothetical protein